MNAKLFEELKGSLLEAGDIRKGIHKPSRIHAFKPVDVKNLRQKLNVSQQEFSLMIGVSKSTLQNWEQGRREPEGPAKAFLRVLEKNPEAVLQALHSA
jgi:putative transcriptional regulator